jgi:hypothetical protein
MIQSTGAPTVENVYANEWGDNTVSNGGTLPGWLNWQYPTDIYHQNGWFAFSSGSSTVTGYLYNNYSHGDLGAGSPTGHISCNSTGSSGCSLIAFNNVLVQTGSSQNPGDANKDQLFSVYIPTYATIGPISLYNNTMIGGSFALQIYTQSTSQTNAATFTFENNIWSPGAPGAPGWFTNERGGMATEQQRILDAFGMAVSLRL